MGTIYYVCERCQEDCPDGCCYDREALRAMPDGIWLCEDCYEAEWEAHVPLLDDDLNVERPDWNSFPQIPEHVSALSAGGSGGSWKPYTFNMTAKGREP